LLVKENPGYATHGIPPKDGKPALRIIIINTSPSPFGRGI